LQSRRVPRATTRKHPPAPSRTIRATRLRKTYFHDLKYFPSGIACPKLSIGEAQRGSAAFSRSRTRVQESRGMALEMWAAGIGLRRRAFDGFDQLL
jgi:hypothetical protein